MKRIIAIFMILLLCLSFAACGKEDAPAVEEPVVQEPTVEADVIEEAEAASPEADETVPEAVEAPAEATDSDFQFPMQLDFNKVEGLSDKYVDFENRAFAYNGTVFKLGESTLRDLIEAGIPFDEDDLNNKGNNINKNYETSYYTARINDYATLQFSFINITDGNLTEEECLLCSVRYYNLYVPQPDYDADRNAQIEGCIIEAAQKVGFSFPITLTKEQLLANCSEGAVEDDYNNVEYKISSEVYFGSSGYKFEFNKATNQMEEVRINWLP